MKVALFPLLLLTLTACGNSTQLEGLQTFTYAAGDHRSGSLVYAENPPAGGEEAVVWDFFASPLIGCGQGDAKLES